MQVERVLQKQLVHRGPARIGFAAFGDAIFAISLRVNVVAAAREQDALCTKEQPRNPILTLVKRDQNGGYAGGMERCEIRRQRALVIG